MWRILVGAIAILPLLGCGGRKHSVVLGKITYKGQPVNNVMLKLYPVPDGQPFPIPVNAAGEFRTEGIPAGEYKVVVESPSQGGIPSVSKNADPAKAARMKEKLQSMQKDQPSTIPYPDKYKNLILTDLKCTISSNNEPINLQLTD